MNGATRFKITLEKALCNVSSCVVDDERRNRTEVREAGKRKTKTGISLSLMLPTEPNLSCFQTCSGPWTYLDISNVRVKRLGDYLDFVLRAPHQSPGNVSARSTQVKCVWEHVWLRRCLPVFYMCENCTMDLILLMVQFKGETSFSDDEQAKDQFSSTIPQLIKHQI